MKIMMLTTGALLAGGCSLTVTTLLNRAYNGSLGLLVNALAHSNRLTQADIDELYAILKEAEEGLQ